MADTDENDIYNDPATIGGTNDDVNGAPDVTPLSDDEDPSESIYTPERDTTDLDDRGGIDELEEDADDTAKHDQQDGQYPEDEDPDADHLGDVEPADERDGTEA